MMALHQFIALIVGTKIPYYLGLGYINTGITNLGHYGKMNKMYKNL